MWKKEELWRGAKCEFSWQFLVGKGKEVVEVFLRGDVGYIEQVLLESGTQCVIWRGKMHELGIVT